MAPATRELAAVEQAKAYQVGEHLLLRLVGEKPNGCHFINVERSLLDVEPPAFIATWYTLPNVRCVPEAVAYEHQQAFQVGVVREDVTLHHAGGELSLDVENLTAADESAVRALADSGPGAWGLDLPTGGGEAIGISRAFDFGEAFRDAITKIPTPSFPDWLATYTVLEVGAQIGGIAGFNHLFVRVQGG